MNIIPKPRQRSLIWQICLTIAVVIIIIVTLSRSINRTVYMERQEMLTLVTKTAANVVNQNAVIEWNVYDIACSSMLYELSSSDCLDKAIENLNREHDYGSDFFFLVDTDGKYYSSDGTYGKIDDPLNYRRASDPRIIFLGSLPHLDKNDIHMVFRGRLDNPVHVKTAQGEADIEYFAYSQDPAQMKREIARLFNQSINFFLYDSQGVMLYKDFGIGLLIEGYNIFPKLQQCRLVHRENPYTIVTQIKNRTDVALEMEISDSRFYFCSSPLEISDWSMALVIPTEKIGSVNGRSFKLFTFYIALIIFALGVAAVILITMRQRRKDDMKNLASERRIALALAEVSQAKTDFLSNLSHDIRTPINGIMGMTIMARGNVRNPDKVLDCLGKIDGASRHLLTLVNDVLDMSRIESGKTTILTNPADMNEICSNCSNIVKGLIYDKRIVFETEVNAIHTSIMADELHLRQILINILGNAVKFTPDGGRIWFRCTEMDFNDDKVIYRFMIQDTGRGMSKEFQEHIFEAFAQEDNRGKSSTKGTGLGMSITKKLVDLMEGSIWVESMIDHGSTFYVDITFDIDKTAVKKSPTVADSSIRGVHVLVVEDNELNLEIAVELLKECGAETDTAMDGKEAFDKFTGNPPGTYDVILMDVMMPVMDGLEATRAIRAYDRSDAKDIPILAMTANAFDADINATREAGMDAHLSKPIDISEVSTAMAKFLNR